MNEDENTDYYPEQSSTTFANRPIYEDRAVLSKEIIKVDDFVVHFEHMLRGEVWLNNKWQRKLDISMNDKGQSRLMTIVLTHVNKIFKTTDLTQEDVYRICKECAICVIDNLELNYRDWEVAEDNLETINITIDHLIFAILKSAESGRTLVFMGMIQRIQELTQIKERETEQPRRGILGRFFSRGEAS